MTTVLELLNTALHTCLAADRRVLLLGEDILDPYGGAFKVTRGLSDAYPDQVTTTPISEAGIVGIGIGLALRGYLPVVEIMFGDFITLAADQLINHAAKFRWMYNNQVRVPLVIRTPMGGGRGYGPTHSQSLEKMFLGTPGLHIVAPCALGNPGELLTHAILDVEDPVLFIEHKLLYQLQLQSVNDDPEFEVLESFHEPGQDGGLHTPTYTMRIRGSPAPTLTIATYGYTAELSRKAAIRLAYEHEIFVEIIAMTHLSSTSSREIAVSCQQTRHLLTIEEGTLDHGWGAETAARTAEALGSRLLSTSSRGCAQLSYLR